MGQPKKIHVGWAEIEKTCFMISKKLTKAKIHPDIILGVSRGGLIPARILSGMLRNNALSTVRVKFYTKPGETIKKPIILEDSFADVKGKTLLIVDDVIESGKTLKLVKEHFYSKGAKNVYLTVLFNKKKNKLIEPDFYAKIIDDKWIVYPWEKYEKE